VPRRLLVATAAVVAVLALPVPSVFADPGPCPVLPTAGALPIEFSDGSVAFRQTVFGRPGITVATSGTGVAKALRDAGASTAYWENNLAGLVGSPSSPADPAAMDAVAAAELQKAQASTGCPNPIIALNELIGSEAAGPLPAPAQQYSNAVLGLMRALAADGATPFLLLPHLFTTHGTEDWWRQVAQVGWLVPEAYTAAPTFFSIGNPFLISRAIRVSLRSYAGRLASIGIPASRIGLMLGFQSGVNQLGREGLSPTAAWLEIVKLESQAGVVVSQQLGLSTLWSWGWGTYATLAGSADPDKPAAACTYLWARDNTLCNAPGLPIPGFDPDLSAGAFQLPATTQCRYTGGSFASSELSALVTAGVSRPGALTALLERSIARSRAKVGPTALLRAQRSVIAGQFDGEAGTYRQFLQSQNATASVGLDVIRDQLLEAKIARGLRVPPISTADVKAYIKAHAGTRTRLVETTRPVTWLVGRKHGVAVPGLAPPAVLAASPGTTVLVHAADGPVKVHVLGAKLRLPLQPLRQARLAARALILAGERRAALTGWLAGAEQAAVDTALCQADEVPVTGRSKLLALWPQLRLQF